MDDGSAWDIEEVSRVCGVGIGMNERVKYTVWDSEGLVCRVLCANVVFGA